LRHELQIAGRAYRLRPVAESDARYIVDLRSRGGTFLNTGAVTVAQQLHWLDRYFERNGDYFFVIETIDGRTREGLVSLYDVRPLERSAEWGRWVLEPRSSAAVESALLVYRCAFEQLSLAQVRCRTLADNAKVVAFHESCGLIRVPSTVMIDHNGQSRPGVEHVLGSGEWPRVKERLDRLASRFADTAMRSAAQKTEPDARRSSPFPVWNPRYRTGFRRPRSVFPLRSAFLSLLHKAWHACVRHIPDRS
jgi:RimJ/RimL family protein N-acetyltransferase